MFERAGLFGGTGGQGEAGVGHFARRRAGFTNGRFEAFDQRADRPNQLKAKDGEQRDENHQACGDGAGNAKGVMPKGSGRFLLV